MWTISKDGHHRAPLAWRPFHTYKCLLGVFQNMGSLFPTLSSFGGVSVVDTWYNNYAICLLGQK